MILVNTSLPWFCLQCVDGDSMSFPGTSWTIPISTEVYNCEVDPMHQVLVASGVLVLPVPGDLVKIMENYVLTCRVTDTSPSLILENIELLSACK